MILDSVLRFSPDDFAVTNSKQTKKVTMLHLMFWERGMCVISSFCYLRIHPDFVQ